MRAIVYERYGPANVLHLKEVEKPVPKDDEILIKVNAVEATKADCEMRRGFFAVSWLWLPIRIALGLFKPRRPILGGYLAGEVEAIGKKVTKFKKGDRIFGSAGLTLGAYAEYVCLSEKNTLVPIPTNIGFDEAAAVPLGGLNALHFMRRAGIKKGDKVLINGAGGSIGIFALQIAKWMDAEVAAVDSPIKKELLFEIGADHFFDYTNEDFSQNGQKWDVIFNMVANYSYSKCVGVLKPGGRYLMGNPRLSDMLRSVLTSTFTNKKAFFAFAGEREEELLTLKKMIEEGKIHPVIDKMYPIENTADAHHLVETEQRRGAVVISFSQS